MTAIRQVVIKSCFPARLAVNNYGSFIIFNNSVYNGQAKPGPFTFFLGCEIGVKDSIDAYLADTMTCITYKKLYLVFMKGSLRR
jgi:hypothetical protein